jgi:flagellar FliJ protein
LDRLLRLRRHRERDWEIKLASITGKCVLLSQEIESRHGHLNITIGARRLPLGALDTGMLYSRDLYMARLETEILELGKELQVREEEREETRQKYLEAATERKVLDKLKEKREAEYYGEQKKEDFKVADDITTGNATRRRIMGG